MFQANFLNKEASLTPEEYSVILNHNTEPPFSGDYNKIESQGTYLCRRCGLALFRSSSKFISSCGWPSFDSEIEKAILYKPDPDGKRTEIVCHRCHGHLGHAFTGENLTAKNLRHCVNSLALDFVQSETIIDSQEIIVAGGCFWGMEHFFKKKAGVVFTEAGYLGGNSAYPKYDQVCQKNSGHYEATRIIFNTEDTSLKELYTYFFNIHDPTQRGGQANDIGTQYESAIFFYNNEQNHVATDLIAQLQKKGYDVQTRLVAMTTFWPAEIYHQDYLSKNPAGYCSHKYKPRL